MEGKWGRVPFCSCHSGLQKFTGNSQDDQNQITEGLFFVFATCSNHGRKSHLLPISRQKNLPAVLPRLGRKRKSAPVLNPWLPAGQAGCHKPWIRSVQRAGMKWQPYHSGARELGWPLLTAHRSGIVLHPGSPYGSPALSPWHLNSSKHPPHPPGWAEVSCRRPCLSDCRINRCLCFTPRTII